MPVFRCVFPQDICRVAYPNPSSPPSLIKHLFVRAENGNWYSSEEWALALKDSRVITTREYLDRWVYSAYRLYAHSYKPEPSSPVENYTDDDIASTELVSENSDTFYSDSDWESERSN